VNQIFHIEDIHNESKNQPTRHLYIKHCFIQQENTFNAACTIDTFKTYPIQHYIICKMLKKPTPTPRLLHINSPRRHSQYQHVSSDQTAQTTTAPFMSHFINFKDFMYSYILFYILTTTY
jgi:hypothetical protein